MLLEFKTSNYKLFKDEIVLSLTPAPKQKDLVYSLLKTKISNQTYKALSTSVIYGPNAAGKSSVFGALDTLKRIISRGDIRNNNEGGNFDNPAANQLELIPNKDHKVAAPVTFSLTFIHLKKLFTYELHLDLGLFLDAKAKRDILFEQLSINNKIQFTRTKHKKLLNLALDKSLIKTLETNLNDEELFFAGGYKTLVDNPSYTELLSFITTKLLIFNNTLPRTLAPKISGSTKEFRDTELSAVAKEIGAFDSFIGFRVKENTNRGELISFYPHHDDPTTTAIIPSRLVESEGTLRFLMLYPLIKFVLNSGGTLIIDEFELSIHPMILLDIVNIFHNDEVNIHNAQLIFTTHNPIFLSPSVFRRDEIKLVEKDKTGKSILYSLADFKTEGASGVRKSDDYMKNYFIDKYGATIDVNLTDFFKG